MSIKKLIAAIAVIAMLGVGAAWATSRTPNTARSGCPGQIECPVTGEPICADQCPLLID